MKEWAKYYAGMGLRIIPITPGSKKPPLFKKWPERATTELQTIEQWWGQCPAANIGVVTGRESGVIDIETDTRNGVRGEDTLAAAGELQTTWSFRSGGGGIHRIFKYPGIHIQSRTEVLPSVDVRAADGYAVFPPSLHPNGNHYEWLPGCSPAEMPEGPAVLPFHLLALLADRGPREPLRAPEEIPEGARNDTLYRLACKMRNDGYEEPEIFGAIWAVNENRCTLPLDQSEVEQICKQAAKYKAGQFPQSTQAPGMRIQSAAQLQRKELGDLHFVVVDLLPQGLSLLASPPKFGKSWFVLDLCLSAANGCRFLGHETHKCDCLYLALEDSERRLKYRMQKLLSGRPAPENFYYATGAPDIDNGLMEQLEDFMQLHPQTGMIVIDTLQKVRGQNARNESAYRYDYREMTVLKAFADSHGILLLLVHHLRKMKDDSDPHARISGTNGILGAADTSLVLTKDKRTDKDTTLAVTGRDVETSETVMQFNEDIDKLDQDETQNQLAAASALARQNREVTIPEVDAYTYGVMCENAGNKPEAIALTAENIYTEILSGSQALDNAEVPETGRVLVVAPAGYALMKKCKDITMETNIGNELRLQGVIAILDGMNVQKIPANRLPEGFGFMIAHPCATVAPVKLEDYTVHENPPGISGSLVEGRICYDAFVLDNKASAIY